MDTNNVPTCAHMCTHTIHTSWFLLKVTYGLLFLAAGVDKFFNILTNWTHYVSPHTLSLFSTDTASLLTGVGVFEIVLGALILLGFTRLGGYIAALWLFAVIANLLSMGAYYDIAVRDVVMAVGALVLSWLTKIR